MEGSKKKVAEGVVKGFLLTLRAENFLGAVSTGYMPKKFLHLSLQWGGAIELSELGNKRNHEIQDN